MNPKEVSTEQESEWSSLRRFGFVRLVTLLLVILVIGGFTFLVADTVKQVPQNSEAILTNCRRSNLQLAKVNLKFAQLNSLFDMSIKRSAAEGRPTPPEILAAYNEYKKPIPLTLCDI